MNYQYSEKDIGKVKQARELQLISEKYGISYCTIEDENYPSGLKEMKRIPPVIYYKGDISIVNRYRSIAVIGSRKASASGMKLAYETGKRVGAAGINVVNGLALGCDTQALKGALEENGKCVAIMPCGLEQIQPKTNQKLADEIINKGGCLISEYPIGMSLQKYQYVERDRLQSGISQGVLVIEAEVNSGTMHTVEFALRQYKRLACYYYQFMNMNASSGNKYLEEAGKATILKSKDDLTHFLQTIENIGNYEQLSLF